MRNECELVAIVVGLLWKVGVLIPAAMRRKLSDWALGGVECCSTKRGSESGTRGARRSNK